LWPLVALYLYSTRPVGQATVLTILGGYLLLPVGADIKIEQVPPFDKISVPNLAALIGCVLVARRLPRIWHRFGLAEILIVIFLLSPFITSELNDDAIRLRAKILPGGTHYDALSAAVSQFIFFIPFILARQYLRSAADNADILRILVVAGLAYSLLMLFEVRMSPQLHTWIYGYFPHSFAQQIRDGGFRPVVFLGHGLIVGLFAMTTAVAATALWRTQTRAVRLPPAGIVAYLSIVLVLCKTLGVLVYAAVLVPLVRMAKPRLQLQVAVVLVTVALTYPLLRTMDFVPTTLLLDAAGTVSADRAGSLQSRFYSEKVLLERASERIWFGWGRWGRGLAVEDETHSTIPDGRWVITLGMFGLFGFVAEFGLLALSVFRAAAAFRFAESAHDRIYLAALALIVAISTVDLIPNGFLSPWTWLLAGALLGRAEALHARVHQRQRIPVPGAALRLKRSREDVGV